MKKILLGLLLTGFSLMASNGQALSTKCAACHGAVVEKSALGKSAVLNGQSASDLYASLIGYKQGTRNAVGMGGLMKGQVVSMSNNDLWAVAEYIASLLPEKANTDAVSSAFEEVAPLAEEVAPAAEAAPASDSPFVCELSDIDFIFNKRYFLVGGTSSDGSYPGIYVDGKTIQIDRKNKTIKVWSAWITSENGRQVQVNKYNGNYYNYGYSKSLEVIDYRNMRSKFISSIDYECNGNVIKSFNFNDTWETIVPDSAMEGIARNIMKTYNIK